MAGPCMDSYELFKRCINYIIFIAIRCNLNTQRVPVIFLIANKFPGALSAKLISIFTTDENGNRQIIKKITGFVKNKKQSSYFILQIL